MPPLLLLHHRFPYEEKEPTGEDGGGRGRRGEEEEKEEEEEGGGRQSGRFQRGQGGRSESFFKEFLHYDISRGKSSVVEQIKAGIDAEENFSPFFLFWEIDGRA